MQVQNLTQLMLNQKSFEKLSKNLMCDRKINGKKKTIVIDIENTIVT